MVMTPTETLIDRPMERIQYCSRHKVVQSVGLLVAEQTYLTPSEFFEESTLDVDRRAIVSRKLSLPFFLTFHEFEEWLVSGVAVDSPNNQTNSDFHFDY